MIKTLVIDNWRGSLTQYSDGDINSGKAFVNNTGGNDPITKPGNLTWSRAGIQIDEAGAVITDLIMAGKERVESGILYVYAIGHTGRLYKIQVNDPVTYNPDYDNPVLLATLAVNSPTFNPILPAILARLPPFSNILDAPDLSLSNQLLPSLY